MKIRKGFVSNSSSASFCCEICDRCYDSDHSPLIVGGLCEECREEYEICNKCGVVAKKNHLFTTTEFVIRRGEDGHEEINCGDGYTDWPTNMTCAGCLVKDPELIDAWIENREYSDWVKIVSDPARKMTPLDKKLTQAILKHGR